MRRAILATGVALVGLAGCSRITSGDPGGHLLAELRSTLTAIPTDAHVAADAGGEPKPDSCDGLANTAGWDPVVIQTRFATHLPALMMGNRAKSAMAELGWTLTGEHHASDGDTWMWIKTVKTGRASVMITDDEYPQRFSAQPWDFYATAPPVGKVVSGC
jgi:hypothetical protein